MKKIEINEIQDLEYEGYLWYSDKERLDYIDSNAPFQIAKLTAHPFVVEGALYAAKENVSITIRSLDGVYYVHKLDLNDLPEHKCIEHWWNVAKDEHKKAVMQEIWLLRRDSLCREMETFFPAFWIFKGFK
jgi:CRISPR type III-associated protein (TIGR04423 family)